MTDPHGNMSKETCKRLNTAVAMMSLWLIATVLVGCKPSVPRKYISPQKLEAILYDYHLANAVLSVNQNYEDTLQARVYKLAVLKKHGVTEAEYDSSMVYYTRHAERLRVIYENLSTRLEGEAAAMGASLNSVTQYISVSNTGDTANVWTGDRSVTLLQHPMFNSYSYQMEVDSTFRAGDHFILNFDVEFIFQDGMRDGVAMMALKLGNDSIISRMVRMSSDNHYKVDIADAERHGIKRILGYFVLNKRVADDEDSQTTLKLMHVHNISLIRMHSEEEKKEDADGKTPADSAAVHAKADSNAVDSPKISNPIVKTQPNTPSTTR